MTNPSTIARLAAAGLALAGLWALAGCGGQPDHNPTATTPAASPTPSPTPTPSPSPTGPIRAADDPTWTPEQLAAVQTVDAYLDVLSRLLADPAQPNFGDLLTVTSDPQYSKDVQGVMRFAAAGKRWVGQGPLAIALRRSVSEPETTNGHLEIRVSQCESDGQGETEQDGAPIDTGASTQVFNYVVQWVDAVQGWRVIDATAGSEWC